MRSPFLLSSSFSGFSYRLTAGRIPLRDSGAGSRAALRQWRASRSLPTTNGSHGCGRPRRTRPRRLLRVVLLAHGARRRMSSRTAAACLSIVLVGPAGGCGGSSLKPAGRFERQVGKLCFSLDSQLRAVIRETGPSGPVSAAQLNGNVSPKLEAEILREAARQQRASNVRAANRSAAVVDSILDEAKRTPAGSETAAKERLERVLTARAAKFRSLAASVEGKPADRRRLGFLREYAAAATYQRGACRAGVEALEREPLG
jgi:hypothetical protein